MLLADLCHHAAMFAFAGSLILVFAACAAVVVTWLLAARWSLRGKLPAATDRPAEFSARSSRMRDSDRLAAVGGHCLAMAMVVLLVWVAVASGTFGELLPGERAVVFVTGCGFAAPVVIGVLYLRRNMVG